MLAVALLQQDAGVCVCGGEGGDGEDVRDVVVGTRCCIHPRIPPRYYLDTRSSRRHSLQPSTSSLPASPLSPPHLDTHSPLHPRRSACHARRPAFRNPRRPREVTPQPSHLLTRQPRPMYGTYKSTHSLTHSPTQVLEHPASPLGHSGILAPHRRRTGAPSEWVSA